MGPHTDVIFLPGYLHDGIRGPRQRGVGFGPRISVICMVAGVIPGRLVVGFLCFCLARPRGRAMEAANGPRPRVGTARHHCTALGLPRPASTRERTALASHTPLSPLIAHGATAFQARRDNTRLIYAL